MGQDHGIVQQKGLILMRLNEVQCEIGRNIRSEFTVIKIVKLAVDLHSWVAESRIMRGALSSAPPAVLPQTGLFESEMMWAINLLPQLPLAHDARAIPLRLQCVGKGSFIPSQDPKLDVILNIIDPRHEFDSGGGAERISKRVGESHTTLRQGIEMRRLVIFASIHPQTLVAKIIRHNQNHVGPGTVKPGFPKREHANKQPDPKSRKLHEREIHQSTIKFRAKSTPLDQGKSH